MVLLIHSVIKQMEIEIKTLWIFIILLFTLIVNETTVEIKLDQ